MTHLTKIKDHILNTLKNEPVKIYLFGSRARNTAAPGSDIDISIQPYEPFDTKKIAL